MTLPTFIIGGARRAGTTSLFYWLSQHPDIYLPQITDIDFFIEKRLFTTKWQDGEEDIKQWENTFSLKVYDQLLANASGFKAIGQKDADLLHWIPSHERLARYLPDCKFIFTLRNPIQRAWSQYWNEVGKGREILTFEEAFNIENKRIQHNAYARLHLSYVSHGFYDIYLESFLSYFPRSQIKIITLEDAKTNPEQTLKEVLEFLDVNPDFIIPNGAVAYNRNSTFLLRKWANNTVFKSLDQVYMRLVKRLTVFIKDPEQRRLMRGTFSHVFRHSSEDMTMTQETRTKLAEIYKPHIQNLEQLLGRELKEWYN